MYFFSFRVARQADGQEVASVVSAQEIRVVAELLQISPEGLQKAITYKVTVSINLEHPYLIQFHNSVDNTCISCLRFDSLSFLDWVVIYYAVSHSQYIYS